jgi:hypothetical protein
MRNILFILSFLASVLFASQPVSASSHQQTGERCFPETGYCISGTIRSYWERNGGLAVFGFPTSPLQTETVETWTGPVQWFERDRLEDHSNQGIGVLAGRLGADLLEAEGRAWSYGSQTPQAGCRFFEQTGYNLCGRFLQYWEQNGGLERFGYPITEAKPDSLNPTMGELELQYFERRRMELHPSNQAPYDVLLGLLGNEIRGHYRQCTTEVSDFFKGMHTRIQRTNITLGCPTSPKTDLVEGSYLYFERGEMLWVQLGPGRSLVYAMLYQPANEGGREYYVFEDACCDENSKPYTRSGPAPENQRFYPRNGFLRVWEQHPELRERIGWATMSQEFQLQVGYQQFHEKSLLIGMYPRFTRWFLGLEGTEMKVYP